MSDLKILRVKKNKLFLHIICPYHLSIVPYVLQSSEMPFVARDHGLGLVSGSSLEYNLSSYSILERGLAGPQVIYRSVNTHEDSID